MDVAWASFWECAPTAAAVVVKLFFAAAELWLQSALAALSVRILKVIWNLGLQIAVEWLHDCRHIVLPCG